MPALERACICIFTSLGSSENQRITAGCVGCDGWVSREGNCLLIVQVASLLCSCSKKRMEYISPPPPPLSLSLSGERGVRKGKQF